MLVAKSDSREKKYRKSPLKEKNYRKINKITEKEWKYKKFICLTFMSRYNTWILKKFYKTWKNYDDILLRQFKIV